MTPDGTNLLAQWRASRRLRLFAGLALLMGVAHLVALAADARKERTSAFERDRPLLARLEGAAADGAWVQRADEAEAALAGIEQSMAAVAGGGQAQAELQAMLSAAATAAGLTGVVVRTEGAAEVEGVAGVWEVSARLSATAAGAASTQLLRDLGGRRWLRVDRVDLRDGSPGQVQMILRAYYRRAAEAPSP